MALGVGCSKKLTDAFRSDDLRVFISIPIFLRVSINLDTEVLPL